MRLNRSPILSGSKERAAPSKPIVAAPTAASPSGFTASRIPAFARASRRFIWTKRAGLGRLTRQDQRGVLAAEAERIRHHGGHLRIARLVADHVEQDRGIRILVVDGRRNTLMLEREQREHSLNCARGRDGVAHHRLVRRHRYLLGALAEHGGRRLKFHLSVFRRALPWAL